VSAAQNSEKKHLDEMTCLLYLERQLERARALEVSAHTQECAACRTLMHALERESRLLTRAMLEEEEPLPVALARFHAKVRRSMQWIWMLSFGLAATGVYALYTSYIEPLQQRLEQAGFGGTNLLGLLIFQGAFWKGWQSMISLIEVLAVGTLVAFGLLVVRRRLRRGAAMALVLTGLCAVLALPGPASATEFRKGQSPTVAKDETIQGDIFLSGERVSVEGTVDGDVYAFGQSVDVPGHVLGDVIVFAQTARVSGRVDGNIRGFDNSLTVTGTIGKNLTEFCQTLTLETVGKAGGSLTAFAQSVTVDGQVGRDILWYGQNLNITGSVGGGVQAKGENLEVASTGSIGGPVHFEGKNAPTVEKGAKLASPVQFIKQESKPREWGKRSIFWQVIFFAAFVLYALVLVNLAPQFARESVHSAGNVGASLGLGILVFFGVLIGAVIVSITIVGLFIGVASFFVWMIAVYAAQPVVGGLIGQWLMGRTSETWPLIGRMTVGLVIIRLVEAIPYGGWIKLGVVLWGLGAISIALYRRFQAPAKAAMPVGPATPLPATTTVGGGPAV
jgi:cytoskeletal protein CcmA (bactofilin family)/predicted anti-sigma-YlaC factor YlaD